MAAGVDDQRLRRLQRLDLLEPQRALLAARQQSRGRRLEQAGGTFDLRRQRRNAGLARGTFRPGQRRARCLGAQPAHRDARDHQLVNGPRRRRQRRGVEPAPACARPRRDGRSAAGADLQIARMRGVQPDRPPARALPGRHRAPWWANRDRARPARSRLRRRRSGRGRPLPSRRRRAPPASPGLCARRNRRAAPWRCRAAPAPAGRRAARPCSGRRADHPPPARAPRP